MGAACCVAAKDSTIVNGPSSETLQRHVRYSPSWSFRWDNRGRVAGEETQVNWLHDGGDGNDQVEVKSGTTVETVFASEEGNPINSLQSLWRKSPLSVGNAGILRLPVSDDAISRNLVEVKEVLAQSPSASLPSAELSPLTTRLSVSTSPHSSQSKLLPPNLTPSRCNRQSHRHQLYKSSAFSSSGKTSYESTRNSNGGSSDSWPIPVFAELTNTRRQRWSFDSENSGFSQENMSTSSQNLGSPIDLQTCGVCAKILTERSSLKMISGNELAVVSVLACGHVYHAECLEYLTPEINKYDPACPVCTHGEKQVMKMSEKLLKAELEVKARKKSRKRVVDSGQKSNIWFDHHKRSEVEERGPKVSSSKSMKSSPGKPFLKRHFSFSSKADKSSPDHLSAQRKGFFWARSSKD
ncbi:hypothetical protein ACS0TY_001690 [Phlomoides rotata]